MPELLENNEINRIERKFLLAHADLWAMGFAILGIFLSTSFSRTGMAESHAIILLSAIIQGICASFIFLGYEIGRRRYGLAWKELIPLKTINLPRRLITAAGWALGLFFLVTASNWVVARVIMQHSTPSPMIGIMRQAAWPTRLCLLARVALFAPILEELFFRHALQRALTTYGAEVYAGCANGYVAFLITSLLFADLHGIGWAIPGLFLFAMGLCFLCRKQDVLTCIMAHGIYNLLVATVVLIPARHP